jgi:hypothetical protein
MPSTFFPLLLFFPLICIYAIIPPYFSSTGGWAAEKPLRGRAHEVLPENMFEIAFRCRQLLACFWLETSLLVRAIEETGCMIPMKLPCEQSCWVRSIWKAGNLQVVRFDFETG